MKKLLVLCALVAVIGCSSKEEVVYVEPVSSPEIDIFYSEADIGTDYFVMTELDGAQFAGTPNEVRTLLIEQAKSQGADAIVFVGAVEEVFVTEEIVEIPTSREVIITDQAGTAVRAKLIRYK